MLNLLLIAHLLNQFQFLWHSLQHSAPGGRKPPLMADVGQSILQEHNIGVVRFVQAKDLRGLQGCMSGREPAMLFIQDSLDNSAFPVRWA